MLMFPRRGRLLSALRILQPTSKWKTIRILLSISLIVIIFLVAFNRDSPVSLEFDLVNKPYASLENSRRCILLNSGQWDCPDIRNQGNNRLRKSQLVLTRMLLIFDALCKKYGLRYWVSYGALLGAVRHQGFIPWDTDIDVEMPIEDYLEFVRKAAKELPTGMILQHHDKERKYLNNPQSIPREMTAFSSAVKTPWNPRFRDDHSCYKYCINVKCAWHDGLMIDIFPVTISQNGIYYDQFQFRISRFILSLLGYETGFKAYPLKRLQFEGFEVPAPNEWERLLRFNFGDNYMNLPPKEKQRHDSFMLPDPLQSCDQIYD